MIRSHYTVFLYGLALSSGLHAAAVQPKITLSPFVSHKLVKVDNKNVLQPISPYDPSKIIEDQHADIEKQLKRIFESKDAILDNILMLISNLQDPNVNADELQKNINSLNRFLPQTLNDWNKKLGQLQKSLYEQFVTTRVPVEKNNHAGFSVQKFIELLYKNKDKLPLPLSSSTTLKKIDANEIMRQEKQETQTFTDLISQQELFSFIAPAYKTTKIYPFLSYLALNGIPVAQDKIALWGTLNQTYKNLLVNFSQIGNYKIIMNSNIRKILVEALWLILEQFINPSQSTTPPQPINPPQSMLENIDHNYLSPAINYTLKPLAERSVGAFNWTFDTTVAAPGWVCNKIMTGARQLHNKCFGSSSTQNQPQTPHNQQPPQNQSQPDPKQIARSLALGITFGSNGMSINDFIDTLINNHEIVLKNGSSETRITDRQRARQIIIHVLLKSALKYPLAAYTTYSHMIASTIIQNARAMLNSNKLSSEKIIGEYFIKPIGNTITSITLMSFVNGFLIGLTTAMFPQYQTLPIIASLYGQFAITPKLHQTIIQPLTNPIINTAAKIPTCIAEIRDCYNILAAG